MLSTSHDGQWAILRRGREVALYATTATTPTKTLTLASPEDTLVFVGPPAVVARVSHAHQAPTRIELLSLPDLAVVATLDLDHRLEYATLVGARLILLGKDHQGAVTKVMVVRTAGRGMMVQPIDVHGVPVEHAAGLQKDQVLLVLRKGVQGLYDTTTSRVVGKPTLPLPPPPRTLGAALGHAWAMHPSTDEVWIYRLSDGRPFRSSANATVEAVVSHPASPVLVLVTKRGLMRLHCQAHAVTLVVSPWVPGTDLALVPGAGVEDVQLMGFPPNSDTPWRISVGKPVR